VRKINGRAGKTPKRSTFRQTLTRRHIIMICLVAVGTFFVTTGVLLLLTPEIESAAARNEYQILREEVAGIIARPTPLPDPSTDREEEPEEIGYDEDEDDILDLALLSLAELARINNDFVGWMSIRNVLEYPVVRGRDNYRYLNTTFTGSRNSAGAIFMDYRNANGFDEKVSVIYGHHTWDGSMFAPIVRYLDPDFMERNPNIIITMRDGRTLTYRVFAARLTDAWDYAYTIALLQPEWAGVMFPDVPYGASNFLLLSTCTRGGYDEERILVFAAR